MKKIIDGKAYNTETATKLATFPGWWCSVHNGKAVAQRYSDSNETTLYQTAGGTYFIVRAAPAGRDGEEILPVSRNQALDMAQACELSDERIEAIFGHIPEAGEAAPEPSAILLRIPDTLKRRIQDVAGGADQSLNTWAMRCLERCADDALISTADGSVRESIQRIVAYLADDEMRDFGEVGRSTAGHIYNSVYPVAKWLGMNVSDWPKPAQTTAKGGV